MNKQKLLVIEDDPGLQKQLRWSFDAYEVLVAGERETALGHMRRHQQTGQHSHAGAVQRRPVQHIKTDRLQHHRHVHLH